MKTVRKNDFYEVKIMGSFSEIALSSLADLYLPLLGTDAFALYLALRHEKEGKLFVHENLNLKTNLSMGELYDAFEKLEATALVKTFYKEEKDTSYFVYAVYSPKLPGQYFADILLTGTLRQRIGEEAVDKLIAKYKLPEEPSDMRNVSSSFPKVYRPNYDDPSFRLTSIKGMGDGTAHIKTDFDFAEFIAIAKANGFKETILSDEERKAIISIGTLYSVDPESMYDLFIRSFDIASEFGKRLDEERLSKEAMDLVSFPFLRKSKTEKSPISGDSLIAEKIRLMDENTPAQYLFFLQGGHKPAKSDLSIANSLMTEMGLSGPLTNAVIDYVLETNKNILSRALCEKIAGSLLREGCKTSRDAMDYLNSVSKKRRESKKVSPKKEKTRIEANEEKEEEITDEMVKEALASLKKK